jgi:hypothetical protein
MPSKSLKDPETYEMIKLFLQHELRGMLVSSDYQSLSKQIYMYATGVELITESGKAVKLPVIGPSLSWMAAVSQGEKAPSGRTDPFVKMHYTGEKLEPLIKDALENAIAWDALKELSNKIYEQDGSLPRSLQAFFSKNEKPQKRGQNPQLLIHRNICIIMLIEALEKIDYTSVGRNSEPMYNNNKFSLCDAVRDVLSILGIELSFEAVKGIWTSRKKYEKDIPEYLLCIDCTNKPIYNIRINYPDRNKDHQTFNINGVPCSVVCDLKINLGKSKPSTIKLRLPLLSQT